MKPPADIAFDCLPLRSVGRVDVPLDASPALRQRCLRLQQALETHGDRNSYFLFNTRCVFRLANSDVENMLRFTFDGTVLTDLSDGKAIEADLAVELAAETCGGVAPPVLAWFSPVVRKAVLIEFDHFIAAGTLAERVAKLGKIESVADLADFAGMNV